MTILESFAEFAAGRRLDQLSKTEGDILSRHLLDTMGAAVAGCHTPIGLALRDLGRSGKGGIQICRSGTIDDVTVRAGTVRHTEVDDIHTGSNVTPSSIIVSTVLTLCARLGISDPQLVGGALMAGYEAILRLGMAIDGPVVMYKGRWPTFFCAPFGAAAVTARLIGLSPQETAHALGIALTSSTGGAGRPGPNRPGRWLIIGEAARAGVASALAAERGFTADLGLLDGNWMNQVHGFDGDPGKLVSGLENSSIIADISLKPCCTGKQVTAALCAFRDLLADGLDPETVTAVEVFVPQRYAAMIDRPVVPNVHVFSFGNTRYQFGLAAYHPEGLYDAARTGRVKDSRLDALMDRIAIRVDEALEIHMPRCWPARVEVTTTTGKIERTVIAAPGDPDSRFDTPAVTEKFHLVADPLVGVNAADDWVMTTGGALSGSTELRRLIVKFDGLFA